MYQFDDKVKEIIKRYFGRDDEHSNTVDKIGQIIVDRCVGKKFVIWGAGEHTQELHKYFSREVKDAKYIVDNDISLQGKNLFGIPVISPQQLVGEDIDVVLISSYSAAQSIEKNIREINLKWEPINLYSILEKEGFKLNGMFYANPTLYTKVCEKTQEYLMIDREESENIIKEIIYLYLCIRDFENANKYIQEYISNKGAEISKFKQLQMQINQILTDIKEVLKKRHKKDITLFFVDSLRAKDVFDLEGPMRYTRSLCERGVYFTKAYSTSIFTYEATTSFFSGTHVFDTELYKQRNLRQEQVQFVQQAIGEGYEINIFTMSQWDMIQGESINHFDSNYTPKIMWELSCRLCDTEKPTLNILYLWQETHPPHMGGKHSGKVVGHVTPFTCNEVLEQSEEDYIRQYKEAAAYLDQQLEFYMEIIGENGYKVLFSDHGQIIEKAKEDIRNIGVLAGWHIERYQVPIIIWGEGIQNQKISTIYSMIHFPKLISGLYKNKINIVNDGYATIQFPAIHNTVIIEKYRANGLEDYLHGFNILIDASYKWVETGNGKTYIYEIEDEDKDVEDQYLREVIKIRFKDYQEV